MKVFRQGQPQFLAHFPDSCRYADHVTPEGTNCLQYSLLVGPAYAEILDATGDLQKHLAVSRQNHAITVGVKLCGARAVTKALRFELTNPLFHAASTAVDLLVHVLGRPRPQ